MVNAKTISPELVVQRTATPLLSIRTYLTQRGYEPPVTVAEIMAATGIREHIVRDVVRALLRSGFHAEVWDGVLIVPQAFEPESEAA